jgi:hypothetical protein
LVAAFGVEAVKVESRETLAFAADGDHTRVARAQQRGHQQPGEGERAKVIDAELRLEAINGPGERHYRAGVVDQ